MSTLLASLPPLSPAGQAWLDLGLMAVAGYLICCGAVLNVRTIANWSRRRRRPRYVRPVSAPTVAPRVETVQPGGPRTPAARAPMPVFDPTVSSPGWKRPPREVGDFLEGERARPFNPNAGPRDW